MKEAPQAMVFLQNTQVQHNVWKHPSNFSGVSFLTHYLGGRKGREAWELLGATTSTDSLLPAYFKVVGQITKTGLIK